VKIVTAKIAKIVICAVFAKFANQKFVAVLSTNRAGNWEQIK